MITHTCETPLVEGSLLRRAFCFPVHEQWDLMLYFSLSMCIVFSRSVRTNTHTTHIKHSLTNITLKAFWHYVSVRTSSRNDLCWHQVLVIVGLSLDTLQPGVQLFVCRTHTHTTLRERLTFKYDTWAVAGTLSCKRDKLFEFESERGAVSLVGKDTQVWCDASRGSVNALGLDHREDLNDNTQQSCQSKHWASGHQTPPQANAQLGFIHRQIFALRKSFSGAVYTCVRTYNQTYKSSKCTKCVCTTHHFNQFRMILSIEIIL